MALQEVVDGRLEHEGVINGNVANFFEPEPARLAAPRKGLVHDIVCDEEEGLKLRDACSTHSDITTWRLEHVQVPHTIPESPL
jgi:hypothetical protein